ncbi:MAG: hypothetical protein KBB67_13260 [Syntrophorhabdus sp.]|jgi:hypothetical protein|nr:hypothetical protein [Syntrophorhabdus sp.]
MGRSVVFTRSISLDLLNEVYEEYISGLTKSESTLKLEAIIGQSIRDKDNIKKTRAILQNLWFVDTDWFHDEASATALYLKHIERLPVHWAVLLVTYPIFSDLCIVLGQLFELKDVVSATQIKEEIFNKWGARSTLDSSLSRNLKSLRDMDTLKRAEKHTTYEKITHKVSDTKVVALLFAAIMQATEQQYMTWESFITHPAIFPFVICNVTQADMAAVPYLTMERMGEQIVFRVNPLVA